MAAGGSAQQNFRKAIGALKDSTTVGLAKVNSGYKELDVAIVKATNHLEVLPKEKHIRAIFDAVSTSRPQSDVAYCTHALGRRLAKTHNWAVAFKTLIVIHRALREVDTTIQQELMTYSRSRGHMLNLSHFMDDSTPNAWDYSAWVRCYALYLEERLECCHTLKYDVQKGPPRMKELSIPDLLDQLPALQQLLFRLLACLPQGMVRFNYLIQYALSIIAAESVKIYVAITDGTLNLVDKFFEMQRHDAVRALEIYKKSGDQAEKLSEFFEICRGLEFGRGQKYVKIEQPPASFLTAMEEYAKEAPQALMLPWRPNIDDTDATPKEIDAPETDLGTDHKDLIDVEEKSDPSITSSELANNDHSGETASMPQVIDLLSLDELPQEASELDDKNTLAIEIVTPEKQPDSSSSSNLASQSTNWELALVTAPSSNGAAVAESKLAGGLDRLTLDSLYNNALATTYQVREVASNPFDDTHCTQNTFYASSNVGPSLGVMQMAGMENKQEAFITTHQQPQLPMIGYDSTTTEQDPVYASSNIAIEGQHEAIVRQQQPIVGNDPVNPFGNPFIEQGVPPQPSQGQNPYSGLI